MIRHGERVFVDTGPWVGLALTRDAMHTRAREAWDELTRSAGRLVLTIPVYLETFTQIDRRATRDAALRWRDQVRALPWLELVACTPADLRAADAWIERKDLHKLSLVDATSFAVMTRLRLRAAFTFDSHFAAAGFRCVG